MKRPVRWSPFVLASAMTALAAGSCSSKSSGGGAQLAQGCSLNSDCASPLVCVFGLCHNACNQTRDCPPGEQCVANGVFRVCLLGSESSCAATTNCPNGLVCGADHACHEGCQSAGDCVVGGQACSGGSCVDTPDGGGSSSGGDGGGGSDGSSGGGDGTTGGEGSTTDGPPPPADAGPLGFIASNVPPGDVTSAGASDAGVVTVSTSCFNCLGTPQTITQNDGSPADLYVLQSLTIDTTATLTFTGANPVIIAALGPVNINGEISVAASNTGPGPGGFSDLANLGPGGGGEGTGTFVNSGGGGAGYCGAGGKGASWSGPAAGGGSTYGKATITPLLGGSAGGSLGGFQSGGDGGGAIQIVSAVSITVGAQGVVNACGGGGGGGNPAGGGAGGAILLEAPTVSVSGTVAANGGGGGPTGANASANAQPASGGIDGNGVVVGGAGSAGSTLNGQDATADVPHDASGGGGGGAGYIRINTSSGSASISGVLSPSQGTACFSQGQI